MTWYYADWSWLHTMTTTAAAVMVGAVIACAIVNLVRSVLTARHAEVVVTNGFVQRSRSETQGGVRHAPHHQNGSRAA